MKIREDIALGQHSHVGMARTENQDFFGFWEPDDDRDFDVKGRIVVVCDGMGGHAGGEIASRLGVQTILKEYQKDTSGNVQEALRKALEAANAAIYREAQREPKYMGMGSTCTTLVHRRDMVYFGQVGDSRGYLIRNGKIKQMTKDHSLVQELVDQGLLDKSEMESHPDKNVILRSLGVKPQVDVDVSYVPANVGDVFLLCSDGLSGPVSEQEMLALVQASDGDLKLASERLIDLANKYGGYDNITVQLLRVNKTDTATTDKTDKATVTGAFTQEQVAESIAKAKAEREKKAGGPAPAAAKKTSEASTEPAIAVASPPPTVETKAPAVPRTQAELPAAQVAPPPHAGGGGGGGKLVLGLVVGLALGAGAGFLAAGKLSSASGGDGSSSTASAEAARASAESARGAAETAQKAASAQSASKAYKRAQKELDAGKDALARHDSNEARARFAAAAALFEVAAEGN